MPPVVPLAEVGLVTLNSEMFDFSHLHFTWLVKSAAELLEPLFVQEK